MIAGRFGGLNAKSRATEPSWEFGRGYCGPLRSALQIPVNSGPLLSPSPRWSFPIPATGKRGHIRLGMCGIRLLPGGHHATPCHAIPCPVMSCLASKRCNCQLVITEVLRTEYSTVQENCVRPQMQHCHHTHAYPRSSAKSLSAPPRASISIFTPPQAALLRQALPSRPLASLVSLTPCVPNHTHGHTCDPERYWRIKIRTTFSGSCSPPLPSPPPQAEVRSSVRDLAPMHHG
jgi:hypothetical protein